MTQRDGELEGGKERGERDRQRHTCRGRRRLFGAGEIEKRKTRQKRSNPHDLAGISHLVFYFTRQ